MSPGGHSILLCVIYLIFDIFSASSIAYLIILFADKKKIYIYIMIYCDALMSLFQDTTS